MPVPHRGAGRGLWGCLLYTSIAGAERIFALLDQQPEADSGYVTLAQVKEENGMLVETKERTHMWAWKHPHQADGTVTYTRLTGDVRMMDVDFGYEKNKIVLHNIRCV